MQNRFGLIWGFGEHHCFQMMSRSDGLQNRIFRLGPDAGKALRRCIDHQRDLLSAHSNLNESFRTDQPVALRYLPVTPERFPEWAWGPRMESAYVLCTYGIDRVLENKLFSYETAVVISALETRGGKQWNYLDHIFGTWHISPADMEYVRRYGRGASLLEKPEKVGARVFRENIPAIQAVLSGLEAGENVVIRMEKGTRFVRRAMELLEQIYSLLPPRPAVNTGFTVVPDKHDCKWWEREARSEILVIPGEAPDPEISCVFVDMQEKSGLPADGAYRYLYKWSVLSWDDRRETLEKIFGQDQDGPWLDRMRTFWEDPLFSYHPVRGSCAGLEELKAEYDRFPLLTLGVSWITEKFREAIPILLDSTIKFWELKAEMVILAQEEQDHALQRKYIGLYQFANRLDPADVSPLVVKLMRERRSETPEGNGA